MAADDRRYANNYAQQSHNSYAQQSHKRNIKVAKEIIHTAGHLTENIVAAVQLQQAIDNGSYNDGYNTYNPAYSDH